MEGRFLRKSKLQLFREEMLFILPLIFVLPLNFFPCFPLRLTSVEKGVLADSPWNAP